MRRRKRRNRTGIYLVMLVAALFVGTLAVHGYSLRANCQKLATEQQNLKDKKKRRGRTVGTTAKTKKAIVWLTEDSKDIEIFEGL